jgi:Heparinase II/III-like protein/Heparinase II/III N-terminus
MRLNKVNRALRGEIKLTTAAREVLRRTYAAALNRRERAALDKERGLELKRPFSEMNSAELLAHFHNKNPIQVFNPAPLASEFALNPSPLTHASGSQETEWRRDPRSGYVWPLDYHRDIKLLRSDGSDIRVLWELNRLGHLLRLNDANEFLNELRTWHDQNPYARGPNWTCAMEVALRAMNILVAFEKFRTSPQLNAEALSFILCLLQQHGQYIHDNLEFSYVATSNHYLSDVTGLLWLGVMLPELRNADEWSEFGLRELLREMDKQVLADGADYESSTGYHRFVTELFLYSFVLCRAHDISIDQRYWNRLHEMLWFIRGYLRPDGLAPLIGDTDSGQVLPIEPHHANDHAYLLNVGAEVFNDRDLNSPDESSRAFPNAGLYIMRSGDCYLCFIASGIGINGRGSHGHNDALSIEVSAHGRPFIVDPGTYVYSADLQMRHAFRSTAYHSTVKIDGEEQNTTDVNLPFVIGDEAQPRVLEWQTTADCDRIVAEHYGYNRLPASVKHRRTVTFNKSDCSWLIEDELLGDGEHELEIYFHFAPELDLLVKQSQVEARYGEVGLTVCSLSIDQPPALVKQHVSRDYGELLESVSACWRVSGRVSKLSWKIYPSK